VRTAKRLLGVSTSDFFPSSKLLQYFSNTRCQSRYPSKFLRVFHLKKNWNFLTCFQNSKKKNIESDFVGVSEYSSGTSSETNSEQTTSEKCSRITLVEMPMWCLVGIAVWFSLSQCDTHQTSHRHFYSWISKTCVAFHWVLLTRPSLRNDTPMKTEWFYCALVLHACANPNASRTLTPSPRGKLSCTLPSLLESFIRLIYIFHSWAAEFLFDRTFSCLSRFFLPQRVQFWVEFSRRGEHFCQSLVQHPRG